MIPNIESPRIFISYSWSPYINKEWVIQFAERLSRDGILVILDEWDAKEGQDKYVFMEQMVNSKEINFVLLICNRDYALKANTKKGGVGIESQIVSGEIYNQVDQDKFIPIVREYDESNIPFLPTFIKNRFYIDLCESENYEENYEKLIRRIYNKPKHKRPVIGDAPSYILNEEPIYFKTAHKLRPLIEAIKQGKKNVMGLTKDFITSFCETLIDFKFPSDINIESPPIDEQILVKLEQLKPLRDDYLTYLDSLIKYGEIDDDLLLTFLEEINRTIKKGIANSYYDYNNHVYLFSSEIFIYTCALLFKNEKFVTLSYLLKNKYFLEGQGKNGDYNNYCLTFDIYCRLLDEYRKQRLGLNYLSVTGSIIKERANTKQVTLEELADTDLLLHYLGLLLHSADWFPRLSVYNNRSIPLFVQKLQSKRYYEKFKILFNDMSPEQLFTKVSEIPVNVYENSAYFHLRVMKIHYAFNKDRIAILD